MKGSVSGEVVFNGEAQGIRGNGDLQFSEGQIRGISVDRATGEVAWSSQNQYSAKLQLLAAGGSLDVVADSSALEFCSQ